MNDAMVAAVVRFWSKINQSADCWTWGGGIKKHYGRFCVGKQSYQAHRFMFELIHGPIAKHLVVDHLCRNPSCVRPGHLEAVTFRENVLRGHGPTALNAGKRFCNRGHPLTTRNVIRDGNSRHCRICRRITASRWAREWRLGHPEEALALSRANHEKYREKSRQYMRDYYDRYFRKKKWSKS